MLKMNKIGKFVLLSLVFFCFAKTKAQQHIENLSPEKFHETIYTFQNAALIDVQPEEDFKKKHIKNAINLPNSEALKTYIDSFDLDTPILLYCFVGIRSEQVSKILKQKGFYNIYTLRGGLALWIEEGLPFYEKTTTKKH